jgi:hypothetical protein
MTKRDRLATDKIDLNPSQRRIIAIVTETIERPVWDSLQILNEVDRQSRQFAVEYTPAELTGIVDEIAKRFGVKEERI